MLISIIEEKLASVCHAIGVKHHSASDVPIVVVFESFIDIIGLYLSLLPEDDEYNKYRFSDARRVEFIDIINHWFKYSSIQEFYNAEKKYTIYEFLSKLKIMLVKANL
ncbi:hypothetical protein [Pseudoalteromonas luteoviolacea]|uniref:hypothetical protein n=1 Tax=Pseudoalteromonas luteoviolacea TaxID=43657 RepID=UPI00114DDB56|nr:hypothetical protein [Pseudoalteromonas luteoviolacea]TQF71133.1 hypothetical protein FLM44_08600 [Pseudoalteromonas luteoviolacea]